MLTRLAAVVDRRAGWVVAAWALLALWITLAAPSVRELGTADQTAFVPASAPSGQADALLRDAFPDDPSRDPAVLVLVREGGLRAADRAYVASLSHYLASPAAASYVNAVQTAATAPELAPVLRSPDGAAELVIVSLKAQVFTAAADKAVAFLREYMAGTAPPGLSHEVTGLAALASDQATATLDAFDRTLLATVVLVLLILVAVYRSVLAPLISLASIGCAFLVARGLAGYLAEAGVKIASLAETFMVVMAFGAGTDYVMFVISRYRETRSGTSDGRVGLQRAASAVAPTIVASGLTVTVGFLAFLSADLGLFRSFGPVLGLAVAVTVVSGLTLTPALLRIAGAAAFWPSRAPQQSRNGGEHVRWQRLAGMVARRPVAVLTVGVALLAGPAVAAGTVHQSFDMPAELPRDAGARQGFETLARHYPSGLLAPVSLVVSAPDSLLRAGRLKAVDRLTETLRAMPGVAEVRSVTQPAGVPLTTTTLQAFAGGKTADFRTLGVDPDKVDVTPLLTALSSKQGLRIDAATLTAYPGLRARLAYFLDGSARTTRIVVALEASPYARSALDLVRDLDERAADELASGALAGAKVATAGPSAYFADIEDLADSDIRTVGAIVVGAILLILALLLRSVVAPLYLMASVLLSLLAAIGITAWVFQDLLGQEGLAFWLVPFLFVMLVALGADYNIFITGRIREEIDTGRTVEDATRAALVSTGPTITSAGFVLAGTFGALLITPIPSVQQIGFGVCAGILIDTFIVRSLLVPAATIRLGKWAFWPSTVTAANRDRRRAALVLSGAGVVGLAATMVTVGLAAGGGTAVVTVAPDRATDQPRTALVEPASTTPIAAAASVTPGPAATLVSGATTPMSVPHAQPGRPAAGAPVTAPAARPRGDTSQTARPPSGDADTRSRTVPSPSPATRPAAAASPGRASARLETIQVPAEGRWQYAATGTQRIGLAGSDQPFTEDAIATVTRAGGTDRAPQMRVVTESGSGTTDERRRYGSAGIDLLSLQVTTTGLGHGGALDPPQRLLTARARVGDSWTGYWRATGSGGTTQATTTATLVATHEVQVQGRSWRCYQVDRETTLTGTISGTQRQQTCWIPALGMPARDTQQFTGTYQGISVHADTDMTLRQIPRGSVPAATGTTPPSLAVLGTDRRASSPGPADQRPRDQFARLSPVRVRTWP